MENHHSIGIIGGGVAGLSLSILLARSGLRTTLFERHTYPFHKVCGEYISSESLGFLKFLGIDAEKEGFPMIKNLRLSTFTGGEFCGELGQGGFGVSRYWLDNRLLQLARNAGVEVKDGIQVDRVRHQKQGFLIETKAGGSCCDLVAGCYGKRSNIDKQLDRYFIRKPLKGRAHFVGVKYHVRANLPLDRIELHTFPGGYLGISAVENDKYCMCYLSRASNLQKSGSIEALESEVLSKNKVLKDYFFRFEKIREKPETISQISFQNKGKSEKGIFMAGDSAGLVAPLSGNGMSMAMHSAYILAPMIVAFCRGKMSREELNRNYKREWQRAFQGRFLFSRVMQGVFFRPALMHTVTSMANLHPLIAGQLIKQTHGKPFYP